MDKWYNWLYAKKAWIAALWVAGSNVYQLAVAAISDEAISLDEAEALWMAAGLVIATFLSFRTVFKATNSGT